MKKQEIITEELKSEELKNVNGGSVIGGQGLDLTNLVGGSVGISQSSSGSDGQGHSYTSTDDRSIDFGLGSSSNATQF